MLEYRITFVVLGSIYYIKGWSAGDALERFHNKNSGWYRDKNFTIKVEQIPSLPSEHYIDRFVF